MKCNNVLGREMVVSYKNLALTKEKCKKTHQIATVKQEVVPMPRLGKKDKAEWAYFINDIGRRQYNDKCRQCVHECKQSISAVIVHCQKYKSKRAAA